MNWGHKIALAFILFAAFIIYMVVQAFEEDFDLVTPDYYAQEIAFDDKMEQRANFSDLKQKIVLKQTGGQIVFTFPPKSQFDGQIHFYHPARKAFDRKYDILLSNQRTQEIQTSQLAKGLYRVNMTWTNEGKSYFQQENIFIQ